MDEDDLGGLCWSIQQLEGIYQNPFPLFGLTYPMSHIRVGGVLLLKTMN